jgi:hypothetical protein
MTKQLLLSAIIFSAAYFQPAPVSAHPGFIPAIPGTETNRNVIEIKGTVTDADGAPLPGVTVLEKGTQNSTTTDSSGNYSITAEERGTLVFSMTGMKEKEVQVAGENIVNVVLEKSANSLKEVVVIGYGKQSKRTLTTAVTKVSGSV